MAEIYGASFDMIFDPELMEIEYSDVKEGDFLNKDGKQTVFNRTIEDGRIIIGITRKGMVDGISGTGTVCSFRFRAKGKGVANFSLTNISLKDSAGDKIDISVGSADVDVLPVSLVIDPEHSEIKLDREGTLSVMVYDQTDLYSASFDLLFDPNLIGTFTITDGGFLSRDGKPISIVSTESTGRLIVGITRQGIVSGISGNGRLAILSFWFTGTAGETVFSFDNVELSNSKLNSVAAEFGTATIKIKDTKAKSIKGRVLSIEGAPVADCKVELIEGSYRAVTKTDEKGEFIFDSPQIGDYEVKVLGDKIFLSAKVKVDVGESEDIDFCIGEEARVSPELEMAVERDGVKVVFAKDTFCCDVNVKIDTEISVPSDIKPLKVCEITLFGTDTTLKKPAKLEMKLPDCNSEDLRIFRWRGFWELVGGSVERDCVKAALTSFSIFGLIPLSEAQSSRLKCVFPNPCKTDRVYFRFDAWPIPCTIEIYNTAGELIKGLENKNSWDVENIASGVYIYIAKGDGWKSVGKIGIVR